MVDDNILEEVHGVLELNAPEEEMLVLSDDQKYKIDKGIADIENGRSLSNEEFNRDIDEWLKK